LTNRGYYVYLLECVDGTLYCGITTDVTRRLREHNSGDRGAKYTAARRPVHLKSSWPVCCLSCTLKTERAIKSLPRVEKLRLIAGEKDFKTICKKCDRQLLFI
jgi:putative endonuclease